MALGDGDSWDETLPTDATTAINIDDHNRDLRKGVRSRMALEHEWPSSQSATSEAGKHKFITLQAQTTKPAIAGTQVNAIYASTDNLYFEKSDESVVQIVTGTSVMIHTAFGAWTSPATSGQVTADGIFVVMSTAPAGTQTTLNFYRGTSDPADTFAARQSQYLIAQTSLATVTVPIKKNSYWLIDKGNATSVTVNFLQIGT